MAEVLVFNWQVWLNPKRLTKRALDAGDSAAFSSSFLASSFFCSRTESTPAHTPLTPTVGQKERIGN